jgi:hypothetical protein
MYYKVEIGTKTFESLKLIWDKMNKCNKEALSLVESLGFTKYGSALSKAAGGISCVESEEKPEGYKQVGKSYQNLYYPKANNKKILKKFNALPIVTLNEYNDTIGFKEQFVSLSHHRAFGSIQKDTMFLVEINDNCDYTPKGDMIELLSSEYKKLII